VAHLQHLEIVNAVVSKHPRVVVKRSERRPILLIGRVQFQALARRRDPRYELELALCGRRAGSLLARGQTDFESTDGRAELEAALGARVGRAHEDADGGHGGSGQKVGHPARGRLTRTFIYVYDFSTTGSRTMVVVRTLPSSSKMSFTPSNPILWYSRRPTGELAT
jgi:hypothetical protein